MVISLSPVKRKKKNAFGLNIWFTQSCRNFDFVIIYAIFPTNPNSQIFRINKKNYYCNSEYHLMKLKICAPHFASPHHPCLLNYENLLFCQGNNIRAGSIFVTASIPFPLKLDGVGPVDNRPSPKKLQHFVKKKKCDTWHLIPDTWHLTHDTWHMTPDTWHLTPDMWHLVGVEQLVKISAP